MWKRHGIRGIKLVAVVGLTSIGLTACGSDSPDGATSASKAADAPAMKKITFVTDFGYYGRQSSFFTAKKQNFYSDAGLDVTFERGTGSAAAVNLVGAGKADFGFADPSAVVLGRGESGTPVKLVATVYQKTPMAIFALESSGITEPKDLEGKSLADSAASVNLKLFPVYAKAAGIDPDSVKTVISDPSALPSLLATGKVDAVDQFSVGEPLLQKAVGDKPLTRLTFADAGVPLVGNGIIASESLIESDPDLVKRFVAATIKGMEYAFAHPDEAGEATKDVDPAQDVEVAAAETKLVAELATADGAALGEIDPEAMAGTVDTVTQVFELKNPVAAEDIYATGFTP